MERDISIENDNLTMPDNLLVPEVVAQSIFNDEFGHNGLYKISMDKCRK